MDSVKIAMGVRDMITDSSESDRALADFNAYMESERKKSRKDIAARAKQLGDDLQTELEKLPGWGESILRGNL